MTDLAITWSGDSKDAVRAAQKIQRENVKLRQQIGQTAKTSKQSSGSMLSDFGRVASQFLILGRAVGIVSSGLRKMDSDAKKALSTMRGLAEARRLLASLSTKPGERSELQFRADSLAAEFGVPRAKAFDLTFQATSSGVSNDALRSSLKNRVVFDPATSVRVAGQGPKLFPASGVTGRQLQSQIFAAAQSAQATPEEFANFLPNAGAGAGRAGSSPSETLALMASFRDRTKDTSKAADLINSFGAKVALPGSGLEGLGIVGAVEKLQEQGPEAQKEFLKDNIELNQAYAFIVEGMDAIKSNTARLRNERALTGSGKTALAVARGDIGPQTKATVALEKAEVKAEIENERENGLRESFQERALLEADETLRKKGASRFARSVGAMAGRVAEFFDLSPDTVRDTVEQAADPFSFETYGFDFQRVPGTLRAGPEPGEKSLDTELQQAQLQVLQEIKANQQKAGVGQAKQE